MRKKTIKKLLKSGITLIGIIALFVVGVSIWFLTYSYLSENPLRNLFIGLGVLIGLIALGGMSWKKVKNKIKDIFT